MLFFAASSPSSHFSPPHNQRRPVHISDEVITVSLRSSSLFHSLHPLTRLPPLTSLAPTVHNIHTFIDCTSHSCPHFSTALRVRDTAARLSLSSCDFISQPTLTSLSHSLTFNRIPAVMARSATEYATVLALTPKLFELIFAGDELPKHYPKRKSHLNLI